MITIKGYSDDIINIDGDLSEEFYANDEDTSFLAFSDGTVLSIRYGMDGSFWRINRLAEGAAIYSKREATDEDNDYSDVVTLDGDIRWVVCGWSFVKEN